MLLCVATSAGTTTTLIDNAQLNTENNSLLNRVGYFSGGTANNLGKTVRVTGNTKSSQTVTFTPAVPSATATDDELELWNQRDEGVTPKDVNDLINDAIADVAELGAVSALSSEETFDYNDPLIVVNAAWEAVTAVEWEDDDGIWYPVPKADLRVDRYQRQVELIGRARMLADGRQVRVRGANIPTAFTADTGAGGETTVDFEWITHAVAAAVLGMRLESAYDRKDVEGRLLQLQAIADSRRPKNTLRLRGGYWRMG